MLTSLAEEEVLLIGATGRASALLRAASYNAECGVRCAVCGVRCAANHFLPAAPES